MAKARKAKFPRAGYVDTFQAAVILGRSLGHVGKLCRTGAFGAKPRRALVLCDDGHKRWQWFIPRPLVVAMKKARARR